MSRKAAEIERLRQKMSDNEQKEELAGVSRRKLADSAFKAVCGCRFIKVKFLLDNGVSASVKNDKGQNLLVAALYIQNEDKREKMLRYLLRRGVPVEGLDKNGRNVLSWACLLGRPTQVKQVLEAAMGNIDLHRQDNEGMTPLHHATKNGHVDVVRILIRMMNKFRLTVDVADVHGLTPYIIARRVGHHDIATLLVNEGNASTKQFDSQNYKSADEWAIIGAEEKKMKIKQARDQELALYKIRGRLPPMEENTNVMENNKSLIPQIILSEETPQSRFNRRKMIPIKETPVDTFDIALISTGNKRQSILSHQSDYPEEPLTSRSMDTAFTLLNLKPKLNPFHGQHPSNFVSSQRYDSEERSSSDDDRAQTSQEAIPSLMQILTNQSCQSFRRPAKMQSAETGKRKGKGKRSTLAIVMRGGQKGITTGTKRKPLSLPQLANS